MHARQQNPLPKPITVAALLCLLSILFGFVLGGIFGAFEDSVKKIQSDSANKVIETVYKGDIQAKDAVLKKSWDYLKRAHLHGGAIGAAGLASICILILTCKLGLLARIASLAFGLGALLYSLFWLLAGFYAPVLGSTSAAKEALSFIALPGAGLCLIGVFLIILLISKEIFSQKKSLAINPQIDLDN